jgi:tetratricopeptide (TPR) repeat protein
MDASRQAAIQTHSVESTVNTPQKRVRQDDAETSERVLGVSSRRNWLIAAASLTLSIPALYFLLPSQRSKVDPAVRQEIASLPGLSGGWWFHEMPWYTPGVRLKVIEALEQGETTIGGVDLRDLKRSLMSGADIATATEQLREVAKTVTHRDLRAAERDAALRLGGTDPESIDQQSFHKGLDEIYEELASSKDRTATQWHLGAVVLQELNRWDEAETWYRGALEAYEASPDPLPELAALACSDYAQLLIDREEGDRLLAAGKLDQARGYLQPMRANCLSTWIGCQGEESQSAVHDLVAANIMAEKTWADADKTFGTGHPLATYAMERAGWSRLELFHLHEARQAFVTALELRRADKSNPRSLRYVIHDEQAIGMCDYFLGKEEAATRLKRIVEEEFPRFLSQSSSPKVRGEMVARLPNTLERLGDCYLFGEFDPREAARHYEASEAAAAQARVQTGRTSSSMVRVRYKHAISLAMSGEREAALAAAETAELADVKVGETAVSFDTEDQRVFGLCREVAEALTQTKDSAGRSLRLEEVLKGREPFLEHHGEINRDELAQLLLISRILLESGKFDETEALTDEQVTSVVDSILEMRDEIVGGGRDADAFFKPYWELAATAVEAHLKQINDEKAKRRLSGLAKDLDDCLKK